MATFRVGESAYFVNWKAYEMASSVVTIVGALQPTLCGSHGYPVAETSPIVSVPLVLRPEFLRRLTPEIPDAVAVVVPAPERVV